MYKRLRGGTILALCGLIAALILTACGGGGGTTEQQQPTATAEPRPAAPEQQPPTPTERPPRPTREPGGQGGQQPGGAQPGGGQATGSGAIITFQNNSSLDICNIFVVDVDAADWGGPRITTQIGAGESHQLTDVPAGTYDVKAQDCDGNIVSWGFAMDAADGNSYTYPIEEPTDFLDITNGASAPICEIYTMPEGMGPLDRRNLLNEGQRVPDGEHFLIGYIPGGYQLQIATCNGFVRNETLMIEGETEYLFTR